MLFSDGKRFFTIMRDSENHVVDEKGTIYNIRIKFPNIKTVNHKLNYVVLKDNTISCAVDASENIKKFDHKHISVLVNALISIKNSEIIKRSNHDKN